MSLNTFVTHPSVRIKGTENNYNPIQCMDSDCFNKSPHMHCPFCVISESFHDPVILKAHYRVKHVDKGLDFAGLKILRCCDHCDIVGAIKGEKKFRGAHWHCYRCKNGFNRRDEAMKHYKTHFRNPQTTFQIQITQEVNHSYGYADGNQIVTSVENPNADEIHHSVHSIHPVLTEAVMTTSTSNNIAANETVNSTAETIMIIEEHLDGSHGDMGTITFTTPASERLQYSAIIEEKNQLEKKVEELQQRNEQLEIEKSQTEQNLTNEIDNLKLQITMQAHAIQNYQKQETELLNQLRVPLDTKMQELLSVLQTQHQDLLHQQLAQVRRKYLQQLDKVDENYAVGVGDENLLVEISDDSVVQVSNDHSIMHVSNDDSVHADTNGELEDHIVVSMSNDHMVTGADVVTSCTVTQVAPRVVDSLDSGDKQVVSISCSVLDDGEMLTVEEIKQEDEIEVVNTEEDGDNDDLPAAKRMKTGS
ncbi:uncharacterized protein LOC135482688 isoform X2 [Lineus longissimus]|uniref:uncharacterized protein LOC135482688 isoform X2 n=1 Tax=Lineus longissimus TaxID=88925 RepID=UPI002B4D0B74